ncbi:MAG: AraC family transcriptional regulator [Eubacteriales bacterium]|nr:AraC family transcriptional regulator [Eubacteriales bacterium]
MMKQKKRQEQKSIMDQIDDIGIYRDQMYIIEENEHVTRWRMDCGDGYGIMEMRSVFPGIDLIYNRFRCFQCIEPAEDIEGAPRVIEINHCRRGSFRCNMADGYCACLGEGDLAANIWNTARQRAQFPSGYYYGLELLIDVDRVEQEMPQVLAACGIRLSEIERKLRENHNGTGLSTPPELESVLKVLYHAQTEDPGLIRLKVLELLHTFCVMPFSLYQKETVYVSGARQKQLQELAEFLTQHPENTETLSQLSERCGIPVSSLKLCFKAMFGKSIHAWHKETKLLRAQEMLREGKGNVAEIALSCGYENASKFAAAFRRQTGVSPSTYRKDI